MKKLKVLLIFIFAFILFTPSFVQAKGAIATASAPGLTPSDDPMGKIILYDDYTIAFYYGYRVNNITILVCKDSICNNLSQAENQSFVGNEVVEFDLNPLLVRDSENSVKYSIQANATFNAVEGLGNESIATLSASVVVKPNGSESTEGVDNGDKFMSSTYNVIAFLNAWIIPGVYVLLGITLIIKGILLAVDIVKYADNSDVRSEKIRAFVYMFIGVVCVAIINSCAGIFTGLFR